MKTVNEPVTFGRCLLGGLFMGIIASVIAIVFNVIYRGAVDLTTYELAMPVSVFMVFPLWGLMAGSFYSLFIGHVRSAPILFAVIILAITAAGAIVTMDVWNTSRDHTLGELKDLLTGMELIGGLMAAFFIPFLVGHPSIYLTDKDIRGEE